MPVGRIFKHSTQPLLQTLGRKAARKGGGSKTIIASPYRYTDSSAGLRKNRKSLTNPLQQSLREKAARGKREAQVMIADFKQSRGQLEHCYWVSSEAVRKEKKRQCNYYRPLTSPGIARVS